MTPPTNPAKKIPVLRPEAWPAGLADGWTKARRPAASRYRITGGPAARWRPATVETVERAVGLWLGWGRAQAHPPALPAPGPLADYVAWLIEARGFAASTVTRDIDALASFAKLVAPERDWGWLRALAKQCKRRERHAPRPLADLRGRIGAGQLEGLGRRLMAQAQAAQRPGIYTAIRYRDGLMLVLLARRAPRRRNVMQITLGRELRLDPAHARVCFPAAAMKGKRPHALGLEALRPELEEWLTRWRPMFGVPRDSGPMWPSQYGGGLHPKAASKRMGDLTEQHLGVRTTMQGARHALATTLSDNLVDGVQIAAAILQHAQTSTTTRSYVRRADALAAQARAEQLLHATEGP